MFAKYLVPVLILSAILCWIVAIILPGFALLFLFLRDIFFLIIILIAGILLGMLLLMRTEFNGIEYAPLEKERFTITLMDGIRIHGEILQTSAMDTSTPVVLVCHGWLNNIKGVYSFAYPLVAQGYKVVCYNHRGHGIKPYKSGGKRSEIYKTFMDIQQVVDYLVGRPDLNHERLAAIGFSLGGYTLLTGGYLDERIKLVIAFTAGHDWLEMNHFWSWYVRLFFRLTGLIINPSDELNRQLSPKFFLQHNIPNKTVCLVNVKNDRVIPFDGFIQNKKLLELPDAQTLVFEKGDHAFFGHITVCMAQVFKWLQTYL